MPSIGSHCHELRIEDAGATWRIIYHVARDAIVILQVFLKKTATTPRAVIEACRKRLKEYRNA